MKRLYPLFVLILLVSCGTTDKTFYPGGTTREPGLTEASAAADLYLQQDLHIEYLDGIKTEFYKAGHTVIKPGSRAVTIRMENNRYITEYFTFTRDFPAGSSFTLGYKIDAAESRVVFLVTDETGNKEALGQGPLIHKSYNEAVIIP